MRKLLFLFLLLFFSIISIYSFAGTIKGTVIDASNNTPLSGVIVTIKNTDKGMPTDIDGNYEFKDLPDGKYELTFSMITYNKLTQTATIKDNNDIVLNIKLKSEGSELKTVTVKTNRATHTEASVILEMRKSSSIVSGISAAQIQKTMDRNAADVVKRVPGVTIQDDKFIIVRGLADRYNTVWLNDVAAPSSEIDKKSFSFDMIPSGLIDRILVFKTPSPELPGDFAGGMVKVYTTSIPEKNTYTIGLQGSYRANSTGTTFYYNQPSSTDWLGYDDGSRKMPVEVAPYGPATPLQNNDPNINAITKSFANNWGINSKTLGPDLRFNASAANVFKIKNIKLGNTFAIAYSKASANYLINRQEWDSVTKVYNYNDQQSETKVNTGILENIAAVWGNNKIEFKNLYNQIGKSTLVMRQNIVDTEISNFTNERSYAMAYESRASYIASLNGSHSNKNDNRKYTWALGYTDMFWNQPDLKRIKYNQDPRDSVYKAQVARYPEVYLGGGRYYASLFEHIYSFNQNLMQKIYIDSNYSFEVNVGNYIEYKSRVFMNRQFGYTIKGLYTDSFNSNPVNEIFNADHVGFDGAYKMGELTSPLDQYSAKNKLIASYISLKLPVGSRVNIVGGVRYEHNTQSLYYHGFTDSSDINVVTKYWLPSINVSYSLNEKNLIRIAYGKTLNRPEFREWSPASFYDFDDKALIYGSLNPAGTGDTLKVAQIQNVDLRWEWYPSQGEMIHAGIFYKSFTNPIQRIILQGGSDSKQITFANSNSAYTAGVEIDVRKNLGFIDQLLNTNIFNQFAFVGNLAFTKSELKIDSAATGLRDQFKTSPLQGQSPYVVNVGLFYQNDSIGLQGSLLYNVFGSRMYALGRDLGGQESIGEMPFQSLDIVLMKSFFKNYIVTFGVQNLLDSKISFLKDTNRDGKFDNANDLVYKSYKPGRYISLGIKIKF